MSYLREYTENRRERMIRMTKHPVDDHGIKMHNGWPVQPVILVALPTTTASVRARFQLQSRFPEPQLIVPDAIIPDEPIFPQRSVNRVMWIVCRYYKIQLNELLSPRRHARIVKPRQMAMYLAKIITSKSFPEIARRMGGRDHTTVLHAVRKFERLRQSCPELDNEIEELRALIEGEPC